MTTFWVVSFVTFPLLIGGKLLAPKVMRNKDFDKSLFLITLGIMNEGTKRGGGNVATNYVFSYISFFSSCGTSKFFNASLKFYDHVTRTKKRFAFYLILVTWSPTKRLKRQMEKDTIVRFRVSLEDKKRIEERAEKEDIKLSAYARQMLLFGEVIKVDPEDKRTLNGIANNLNQLTRYYNQTGERKPELEDVLKSLIDEIRHAYRKR